MRLRPDTYFDTLSREELIHQLKTSNQLNSFDCDADTQVLNKQLKMYERTCHLTFRHDESSFSSHSRILIVVSCLDDTAVFVTDEEYFKLEDSLINIQAGIEKPFLYLTLIWEGGSWGGDSSSHPPSWFSLNNSKMVKAVTHVAAFSNILLVTFMPNLVSITPPVSRYWTKPRRDYFRFSDFWSIPYKIKSS